MLDSTILESEIIVGCPASFSDFPRRRWEFSLLSIMQKGKEPAVETECIGLQFRRKRVRLKEGEEKKRAVRIYPAKIRSVNKQGDTTIITFCEESDNERVLIFVLKENFVIRIHVI